MKKFMLLALFITSLNLSCNKCGCGIAPPPMTLGLIIKDINGKDLLSPSITGYYSKNDIKLYKKLPNGEVTNIKFDINKPNLAGQIKTDYYQLLTEELLRQSDFNHARDDLFLQLRDEVPYKIFLHLDMSSKFIKLYLSGYEAVKDENMTFANSVFHYTKR